MKARLLLSAGLMVAGCFAYCAEEEPSAPEKIERSAYLSTETNRWQDLQDQFPEDEVVSIDAAGAVFRTQRRGRSRGVFVIVGDAQGSLDNGEVGYLRREMSLHGWHTLAAQLPHAEQAPIPERLEIGLASAEESPVAESVEQREEARIAAQKQHQKTLDQAITKYRTAVKGRINAAHTFARNRAEGKPVLFFGVGEIGHWLTWYEEGETVDGMILVDIPLNPSHFPNSHQRIGDLQSNSLILQRTPTTWSAHKPLGPGVELHILPKSTEVNLERKIRGWVKRRYK